MKKLAKRLMEFVPAITNSMLSEPGFGSFDFVRSKHQMLHEFRYCATRGNVVGVYSPAWGNGMFLVGVERLYIEGDSHTIVFHTHDMSGHAVARRALELDEITSIVPFNNPYVRPVTARVVRMSVAS